MDASLSNLEIGPRHRAWRELSPDKRFLAMQQAVEENKSARQRVINSLKLSLGENWKKPGQAGLARG